MDTQTLSPDVLDATASPRPRVLVLCDGEALRSSLTHAFGPGYAEIDPASLAARLADDRDWSISRVTIYLSSDTTDDDHKIRRWSDRLKATQARLMTQPGDVRIRMALDATRALRLRQTDVVMVMGADASFMALAQDTRTAAREQNRDIRFASAFAPSTHSHGKAVPSADLAVRIDRTTAEKSLLLASGTTQRRVYAARPSPTPATAQTNTPTVTRPPLRRRITRAAYGVGFAASMLALIWEDVVASGLANGPDSALTWDHWRWGVSVILAVGKSIVWPLYWLARAFGIEAG